MPIGSLREAPVVPPSPPAPAPTPAPQTAEPSAFSRLLHGLGREVNHGEAMMKSALAASRSGRDLSSGELIALQAGVYRYSEAVDLAAKLVDRTTSGVKTVLQGQ
jgi:hypothetical protein